MKPRAFDAVIALTITTLILTTAALADEAVPYVSCLDEAGEYVLLSQLEHRGLEFYNSKSSADVTHGLASEVSRRLVGSTAQSMKIKTTESIECGLKNESSTPGIQTFNCVIPNGSNLSLRLSPDDTRDIVLTGGTIKLHINGYYDATPQVTLNLITQDGKGVTVKKSLAYSKCTSSL